MSYELRLKLENKKIQQLLSAEYKNLSKKRFSVKIEDSELLIRAEDAKALKGILFSITNALETFEEMEEIIENG